MSLMPACLLAADSKTNINQLLQQFWTSGSVSCSFVSGAQLRHALLSAFAVFQYLACVLQIQMQDVLEAAVAGDDKGKLEQHLQANEAQACLSLSAKFPLWTINLSIWWIHVTQDYTMLLYNPVCAVSVSTVTLHVPLPSGTYCNVAGPCVYTYLK